MISISKILLKNLKFKNIQLIDRLKEIAIKNY